MTPEVLFMPASATEDAAALSTKIVRLYDQLPHGMRLPGGAKIGIKVHLGEGIRPAPIPAGWLRPLANRLGQLGAAVFFTDTCTLYRGERSNAIAHSLMAAERGFTPGEAGGPFLVADGLFGEASVSVPITGSHFATVEVANAAVRATGLVVCSHFTGHLGTSMGAAVKNLGMGLASRAGKLQQHAVAKPRVEAETCTACELCREICPERAIELRDEVAVIDRRRCSGCGQCLTVCYTEAIQADYSANSRLLQERMAEFALGVVQGKTDLVVYLTFLLRVTRDCDCIAKEEPTLFPDIGLLAASDPVAIDQAACDLVTERTGRPIEVWCGRDLDPSWQLAHGEAIGLGSRRYTLRELSADRG
ncbi:MAG: DUF362 domain-containing protein [bacterium]